MKLDEEELERLCILSNAEKEMIRSLVEDNEDGPEEE